MRPNLSSSVAVLRILLAIPNLLTAQHIPEQLLKTAVLIQLDNGKQGSGFYLQDSLHTYLITARHVLFEKMATNGKDSLVVAARHIECISYPADPSRSEKTILSINLEAANDSGMVRCEREADVGAIQVGDVKKVNDSLAMIEYLPFANKDRSTHVETLPVSIIQEYNDIHLGETVYIFGYPTSIGLQKSPQFDHERPLLRKGSVAGKNASKRTVIIDCPTYYGNSGGPVIVEEMDGFTTYYKLIGVVSEFVPYEEDWKNSRNNSVNVSITNSGYSVVVPIESILHLYER